MAKSRPSGRQVAARKPDPPAATVGQFKAEAKWSYPIPPPSAMRELEDILPGMADRLMNQWESQTQHRIELELIAVKGGTARSIGGLVCGTIVALAGMGVAYAIAQSGQTVFGGLLAAGDLAAIVGSLVYGVETQRKERKEKAKVIAPAPR